MDSRSDLPLVMTADTDHRRERLSMTEGVPRVWLTDRATFLSGEECDARLGCTGQARGSRQSC